MIRHLIDPPSRYDRTALWECYLEKAEHLRARERILAEIARDLRGVGLVRGEPGPGGGSRGVHRQSVVKTYPQIGG
jgi:hypothetical protein